VELIARTTSLEPLDLDECHRLLYRKQTGRLAWVNADGEVEIVPVNYLFDRGAVLVRTAEGSKLDATIRAATVAFQIDGFDAARQSGWSVLVKGRAAKVWDSPELDYLRRLPLHPWAPGEKEHYLVVFPTAITGRRIVQDGSFQAGWWS
jgi:uncharacterized protein